MSIPLDRLYYYIKNIAQEVRENDIVIYHFWPHGSKNIENLVELCNKNVCLITNPRIICHDQEPLNFEYYNQYPGNLLPQLLTKPHPKSNIFSKSLLLHSEQRSQQVNQYSDDNFIPVYYWSHAIIAHDWFRYAQHLQIKKRFQKLFLTYNRAWSGTREYRLAFADKLIKQNLVDHIVMRISPVDSSINKHYSEHRFENSRWEPKNIIENYFPLCQADSHASADFDIVDYESTAIEVVLETLFDDSRLHLTEKTLRPIALGQPFILAGTQGSLEYLKQYGFQTYSSCWDEQYDTITDPVERLECIVKTMQQISQYSEKQQQNIFSKATEIANFNKSHFFSNNFFNTVINELKTNLKTGMLQLKVKS